MLFQMDWVILVLNIKLLLLFKELVVKYVTEIYTFMCH